MLLAMAKILSNIGENIDGWCTRCKMMLRHTIEAVVAGKITRVHCNTCQGRHVYRAKAPRTRVELARSKANGRMRADGTPRPSGYETLLRGRTAASARPYSTSERFKVSDLISHGSFGLGAVTAERDNVKIDVLFADGMRVLVHGRSL